MVFILRENAENLSHKEEAKTKMYTRRHTHKEQGGTWREGRADSGRTITYKTDCVIGRKLDNHKEIKLHKQRQRQSTQANTTVRDGRETQRYPVAVHELRKVAFFPIKFRKLFFF